MKAEMDARGMITLTAETSVEEFALGQWASAAWVTRPDIKRAEDGHWRGSMLMIEYEMRKES